MIRSLRTLLFPFSALFCAIAGLRNFLYNKGIIRSYSFPVPVISIGNLTVGGTGKTPLTEFLIKHFSAYHCALLSRGYGRKTKGPIVAAEHSTPETIGDEPVQMKLKFPGLKIVVAEKRVSGMNILLKSEPVPDIVFLDDAFQHRAVKPRLSIVVTDYYRPVYNDLCLPAGNLREPRKGMNRAQVILVNKCPVDMSPDEANEIQKKLSLLPSQQLFFSSIAYQSPQSLLGLGETKNACNKIFPENPDIIALAGIGNPKPFFSEVKKYGNVIKDISYPDHHDYTSKDIEKLGNILSKSTPETIIFTTEKDAVRLKQKVTSPGLHEKIWYIPIELKILFNKKNIFLKTVNNYVETN
ncbi:MAG: tetraacyldisaccharide 4-kinase [Anaerophaga sp.]|nr:tetraacyldisaccharide 4-kinase [Anaerophaga sp.]MDN5290223.1 tetraacyldisaccharide 4-kinase [Anaerophaga sp.]